MKKFLLILMTCVVAMGLYAQIPAGDGQPCPGTPTVTDHEGNVYNTVKIGNQCWTKENLRTTTSPSTGTYLIPAVGTDGTYTGKQAFWYNNDVATYAPKNYGLLYNWNAAADTFNTAYGELSVNNSYSNAVSVTFSGHRRGICPEGWHLPSDAEWTQLTNYVGSVLEYQCGGSSSYIAKALASETGWSSYDGECYPGCQSVTANNATGFSAVPAGYCIGSSFSYARSGLYFWSSSQDASYSYNAYDRNLNHIEAIVNRSNNYKKNGFSVRCLRDAPVSSQPPLGDAIPCPGAPTVTDVESNVYNTVKIGNQCWTKENLRTTKTKYGVDIICLDSFSLYDGERPWFAYYENVPSGEGGYYSYMGDSSRAGGLIPFFDLGYLYSHNAAKMVCPVGWHLPSDAEWTVLTDYLNAQTEYTCNGHIAKTLASTQYWNTSTNACAVGNIQLANNVTGFSAIPAGISSFYKDSYTVGYYYNWYSDKGAVFWSSSVDGSDAWTRSMGRHSVDVSRCTYSRDYAALSVRCLRDPGPAVTTGAILGVTPTSATCSGEVVNDGGSSVTARGVCWSTEHVTTITNNHTSNGTGIGEFTSNITGLTPGTTYYVRAYATNSEGTSYGEEVSFTTLECPIPTDATVSEVTTETATITWEGTNDSYQVRYRTPAGVETFLEEGFENGIPSTWKTIDQDGDGYNWSDYSFYPHSGTGTAASESFHTETQTPLTPDNWLITPRINLQGTMKVWLRAINPDYTDEHFAIYLSTTGDSVENFITTLVGETVTTSTYTEYSADLSSYAGQQGFIAIRHFNCTDMDHLLVDDFGIYGDSIPAGTWHTVSSTGTSTTLTGLTPGTRYEVQVQGMCDGNPSEWGESVDFTTDLCDPEDLCELTFVLTDSYGDGWNGNAIQVTDAESGAVLGIMTNEDFNGVGNYTELTQTIPLFVCDGRTLNFEWIEGQWANETSYTVYDGNGEVVFSGSGGFTGPISYTVNCAIPCDAITLPYTENFDGYTTSTTAATGAEPTCWNLVQSDVQAMTDANRPQLYYKSSYAHSGSYSLLLNYRGVYAMPELSNEIPINQLKLEMYLRQPKAYYQLQVGVWEDNGTFVPVATFNNSGTGVTHVECNFSSYTGNGNRIAFRNVLANGYSYKYSYNYIDDITLMSNCAPVTLPYTENFDNYTTSTTAETGVQPDCWEVVSEDVALTASTKPQLYHSTTYATSGSYTLRMKNRCVYAMPELDENVDVSGLTMTFKLRQPKAVYRLQVGVVDSQGTFKLVKTVNNASTSTEDVTIDFANYTGSGHRIAFRNTLVSGSTLDYSINYIDDITLDYTPAPCGISELPYAENFDSYTTSTTAETGEQPRCWEVVSEDVALTASTKPQLYHSTTYATSGSYTLRMKNRCVYAMPELDENVNVNDLTMTFRLRQPKAVYRLQVGVVDGQGTFKLVKTVNNASTGTEDVTVDFANYTGNGHRIAFRNTLVSGSTLDYSINYIDDITLDYTPASCGISELPYSENFDNYTQSTTTETGEEPDCWELYPIEGVTLTNATKPQLYRGYASSGAYSLRMKNRCVYAMPELDENVNINELTMTMKLRQPKSMYRLQVGVLDGQETFKLVKTLNNTSTNMEDVTVSFANYTGNGHRIAFRNTLVSGSTLDYSINYIDDITLDYAVAAKGAESDASVTDVMAADRDMVDVVVYPNPTKEFVNVQCTMNNDQGSRFNDQGSNVQCLGIEVVDVYGKVVRTVVETFHETSLPTQINVSGLATGMYFVRVTTDRGVVTKNFIKR